MHSASKKGYNGFVQIFKERYKQLNTRQREAVATTDGPMLVIAGPGTGKTQLLGMRVANILTRTDTDPQSILCLTFTNKAATNMRERLVELIGGTAHSVHVHTFHSFAAELMSQYPDYFWNGARLSTAPNAVQLAVVQEVLSELAIDNPLAVRYNGVFSALGDVQMGLKLVKEAGLTPAKLRALIEANLAYIDLIEPQLVELLRPTLTFKSLDKLSEKLRSLPDQSIDQLAAPLSSLNDVLSESLEFAIAQDQPSGKTKYTGTWKRRWVQQVDGKKGMFQERRRNEWWLHLADVYERYRDTLLQRGYYDYADMLVQVIAQLEQHAELRAQVQEQFLYVLIDEFQDTNAAQLRLAHLIADAYDNLPPNLMAVGDDDQSIFKFNGAELNNMLSFKHTYPSATFIVLEENYRSTQDVLDTAKTVIEQAEDRLVRREPELSKNLQAVQPPAGTGMIQHLVYPTRQHQYSLLAADIAKRRADQPEQTIAVLARSHSSLRGLAMYLTDQAVPINYEQQQNILDHEAIQQILWLTRVVSGIHHGDEYGVNAALSQVLRHPMWKVKPEILWELAKANVHEPKWLESLLMSTHAGLAAIGHWLVWLAAEAAYQPLPVMLEYMMGLRPGEHMSSPLHAYFTEKRLTSFVYLQTLSAVNVLRGLVSEFSQGSNPTLSDFLDFIELNRLNNKVVTDTSWFMTGEGAVELLTVHKAKGLEFDAVYIIDAVEKEWQPHVAGRKPPANLPLQPYGDDYDDYVRLMYVAVTRARHSVIISSFATNDNGEAVLPYAVIAPLPTTQLAAVPVEASIVALETSLRWPRLDSRDEHKLLHERLQTYQLSITHLLNFLDVSRGGPQYFLERNLLRLPEIKSPRMAFGIAAHSAMEIAQKLTNTKRFNLGKVLTTYEQSFKNQHLPAAIFDQYLAYGQQMLTRLFKTLHYSLTPGALPEQVIRNVMINTARVTGSLDRLSIVDDALTITDYKTGTPLSSFDTRDKTKQLKAWRQRTQLIFYTLLVQNHPRYAHYQTVRGEMVYIEAGSSSQLLRTYQATPDELTDLATIIQNVWHHIMTLNFPDTSGYTADITGIEAFIHDLIEGLV